MGKSSKTKNRSNVVQFPKKPGHSLQPKPINHGLLKGELMTIVWALFEPNVFDHKSPVALTVEFKHDGRVYGAQGEVQIDAVTFARASAEKETWDELMVQCATKIVESVRDAQKAEFGKELRMDRPIFSPPKDGQA